MLWDPYPCAAARCPAAGSDRLHLCQLLSGHLFTRGFMSLKLYEKQLGLDCGFPVFGYFFVTGH